MARCYAPPPPRGYMPFHFTLLLDPDMAMASRCSGYRGCVLFG